MGNDGERLVSVKVVSCSTPSMALPALHCKAHADPTRSTESHSPPPDHAASFDPRYWPQPQPQKQQTRNGESLIKQTYSTTMIEDGKEKKWHVVAYANKVNPLVLP
jgi:hypothetical protein